MALTFSSARSRSVICFASVAMKEASLLEGLAEPTPGTPEISHSKRCGADVRQRRGGGGRREGGLPIAEGTHPQPALEAGGRPPGAVPPRAPPARPPPQNPR